MSGLIGTNPQYPPVIDHSWLNVNPATYDNYPSDNNPVRVLPKLSDLWRMDNVGTVLIPNVTVQSLGVRSSDKDAAARDVIREAKKAAMNGKSGKDLAEHLRARFSKEQIEAASEGLRVVADEIGLLGNVYIDASAFSTEDEADKFLATNRSKLARDLVYDPQMMNAPVITKLAVKHRKNAVTEIAYTESLFDRYKGHLVATGKITDDYVIDSKESLKQAFLSEGPEKSPRLYTIHKEKVLSQEEVSSGINKLHEEREVEAQRAKEAILASRVRSVVSFIQENLSKGKSKASIKDMIRSKFTSDEISEMAPYIALTVSKEGLTANHVDQLISKGSITELIGNELKKIAKKHPIKTPTVESSERAPRVMVRGFFHAMQGKGASNQFEPYRKAALTALQKGFDPLKIQAKLATKVPAEDARRILAEAVVLMNSQPAGSVANKIVKTKTKVTFEEKPRQTLPDPSTIEAQTKEILGYFEGSEMKVDAAPVLDYAPLEVDFGSGSEGIDNTL